MTNSTQTTPPGEQTGATDEQIEAATNALHPEWGYSRRGAEQIAEIVVSALVPPGFVIAPAASVIGPDQRAVLADGQKALEYVLSFMDGYKAPEQIGCAVADVLGPLREHLALLRDLATGGAGDE